jgi:hypothetical protein
LAAQVVQVAQTHAEQPLSLGVLAGDLGRPDARFKPLNSYGLGGLDDLGDRKLEIANILRPVPFDDTVKPILRAVPLLEERTEYAQGWELDASLIAAVPRLAAP